MGTRNSLVSRHQVDYWFDWCMINKLQFGNEMKKVECVWSTLVLLVFSKEQQQENGFLCSQIHILDVECGIQGSRIFYNDSAKNAIKSNLYPARVICFSNLVVLWFL